VGISQGGSNILVPQEFLDYPYITPNISIRT
jgi:hypothetical protein